MAIGQGPTSPDAQWGRLMPSVPKSSPTRSCDVPEGITFHPDSELGEPKLDFVYLDELFDMVQSKWTFDEVFLPYI